MPSLWKLLDGSAVGTSHERRGESCQDYSHARTVGSGESSVLAVACSDGAGSASHAALGAKVACLAYVHIASEALEEGLPVSEVTDQRIRHWHEKVCGRLSLEACLRNLELRDFACTLLTAIASTGGAVFSQIGDGAIIYRDGDGYKPAFWPQNGEYSNTTFFLTGPDFQERLEVRSLQGEIDELALFTDGLQPLALHYASRTVHGPFFEPMFESLRNAQNPEDLEGPLRRFLTSNAVNDRTDDDKTLVLASRRPPAHDRL